MTSDARPSDPRASLAATAVAVARATDLDAALGAILGAVDASLHPRWAPSSSRIPTGAASSSRASSRMDADGDARLTAAAADPAHPFAEAAIARVATFDRESTLPSGAAYVGAYLPLLSSSGGVEVSLGSIGFGWLAPRALDADERDALEGFAALATLAVDRARLESTAAERSEWFERMAHSDPLTGLANERTVGRVLELELARAGRQGSEVSLAIFDVDDFQATNRDGGHEAGDDVLRQVAAVLAESVRLVDTVGRIGGDEFVLVAPGSAGDESRGGSSTGSRPCPRSPGATSRSPRASPASRPTAPMPRAHRGGDGRAAVGTRRGPRPRRRDGGRPEGLTDAQADGRGAPPTTRPGRPGRSRPVPARGSAPPGSRPRA